MICTLQQGSGGESMAENRWRYAAGKGVNIKEGTEDLRRFILPLHPFHA